VKLKKDCLSLPDKFYRVIQCPPTEATKRVAKALLNSAPNAMTGLTLVRELSDGFQYREEDAGTMKCPHCVEGQVEEWFDPRDEERVFSTVEFLDEERCAELTKRLVACPVCDGTKEVPKKIRTEREVPCPKDAALKGLLEECEETGRIVIFAGFTGSVNRCVKLCQSQGWNVVRCDGRGFTVFQVNSDGSVQELTDVPPLDYWSNLDNEKVAFVAHPESGGMSLTLTQSSMAVFYSNSYKSEFRTQAEDRVHRIGADHNRGVTIVDLVHLPTDEKVLATLKENRKLELLTLGELAEAL
jgi:SNF2 family DNA or RNA helicase